MQNSLAYYQSGYYEGAEYQWEDQVQKAYYMNSFYNTQPQYIGDTLYQNIRANQIPEHKGTRKRFQEREEDKVKYIINLENILNKADNRTSVMIKNIPNKYSQIMLLNEIDENHKRHYDFFYLPIDFKVFILRIIYIIE